MQRRIWRGGVRRADEPFSSRPIAPVRATGRTPTSGRRPLPPPSPSALSLRRLLPPSPSVAAACRGRRVKPRRRRLWRPAFPRILEGRVGALRRCSSKDFGPARPGGGGAAGSRGGSLRGSGSPWWPPGPDLGNPGLRWA
jgi:hypothetical protein